VKSRLLAAAVAVVALALGAAAYYLDQNQTPDGGFQVLKMNLADADGRPQPMQQWDGKILVINYWATWCPPCLEEMPGFSRLHQQYSPKGVQFVGIGIDVPDKIRHFRDSKKISYSLLVGGMDAATTSVELGNKRQALPFTALFDGRRQLVAVKLGRWQEADLERELQTLLGR
jgi:thiol-disulfide isomerase/thioredoxin